ncbi:hypothetical protein AMTRI_Chr01g108760 [Amborella trichopoda]
MPKLENFIHENELLDFNLMGPTYTWSNNSAANPWLSKIERATVTPNWENLFPKSIMKTLPQWSSDHVPVLIDTEGEKFGCSPPF